MTMLGGERLTKAYAEVPVLRDVSLGVRSGEVHALVGENGAGKTTLLMILSGAVSPDGGRLLLGGEETAFATVRDAQQAGIATVFQELSLSPGLTVAENVWAGHAPTRGRTGIVDRPRMVRETRALLRTLECHVDPLTTVGSLGMGARQLVEIAKALSVGARVLLLDEPTASLTPHETAVLFATVRRLTAQGLGVVFVSHRLAEVFEIADRISVLRDGELRATFARDEVTPDAVVAAMVGRELSTLYPERGGAPGAPRLRLLEVRGGGVGPVDLEVCAGEIVGLAGLRGAGRTRLAELVAGVTPLESGAIVVDGRPVRLREPRDAIRAGIGYVPANRARDGIFPSMGLAANVCAGDLRRVARRGLVRGSDEARLTRRFQRALDIRARDLSAPVARLSGGNQQKVLLARCLLAEPRVLVVDEPTQGVDVRTKADIHRLLRELAASGAAILMISSELPEVLGMADRIAVMGGGRVRAVLDGPGATEQRVLEAAVAPAQVAR